MQRHCSDVPSIIKIELYINLGKDRLCIYVQEKYLRLIGSEVSCRFSPMLLGPRYTMHLELLHTETHLLIFTLILDTVQCQLRAYDDLDILTKLYYKPISSQVHSDIGVQISRQKAHFLTPFISTQTLIIKTRSKRKNKTSFSLHLLSANIPLHPVPPLSPGYHSIPSVM
jgi:hypothetical protein